MLNFITGSRAYGTPTEKSDIDLVVRVDSKTASLLRKMADSPFKECRVSSSDDPVSVFPVRFGKLNLILCETDAEFAVWAVGTEANKHANTVPRDRKEVKAVFDELRKMIGVEYQRDSG